MATNLTEERRTQLDGIVQKMIANNESESNIRFVVDDFKQKYAHESVPPVTQPPKEQGSALGDFAKGALSGFSEIGRTIQTGLSKGVDALAGTTGFGAPEEPEIDTTAGKVGRFVGEAVPYVINPSSGVAKGVLRKVGTAVLDTAIGTAQTGDPGQGVTIGVGGQALGMLGKPLKSIGQGLYKLAIPLSAKEAPMVQAYKATQPFIKRVWDAVSDGQGGPTTHAETAFTKNLFGTQGMIGIQAKQTATKLWGKVVSPALKGVDATIHLPEFFSSVESKIIKSTPELTTQKELLKALEAIKEDYKNLPVVSAEDLQKLKEGWAKNLPQKIYKGEDIAGAYNNVKNYMARQARQSLLTLIDDPKVKQAYIDYGNLKELMKFGQKGMVRKITGGTGTVLGALKDTVVIPIATIGGNVIYRTGKGLEFIGTVGAKTLNDIFNNPTP